MHIGIAGPIATADVTHLLGVQAGALPAGHGGAPLIATLITALVARGHQVTAFTTTHGCSETVRVIGNAGETKFTIYYVPVRPTAFRPTRGALGRAADFFRRERHALSAAMRDTGPDLVHAHWTYEFGLAAVASGLPHIVTCHDAPQVVLRYMPNAYRAVRYLMARQCLASSHHVTAVSPYLRNRIAHYARASVEVIPNPLAPLLTTRLTDLGRLPAQEAPHLAMAMNGWGKLKNPQPALRAFAMLRSQIRGARLRLYGADFGPGEFAEQWARRAGIEAGMEFVGALPHGALLDELRTADALIHSSREETFGMAVAEAMALGVPVIAGDRSGAIPWVLGDAGVFADIGDAKSIFTALQALFRDPQRYTALRRIGVERSRTFDAARIAEAYEATYLRCLGNPTKRHARPAPLACLAI